jgi:molybdate transport system substrate-binding protein
MSFQTICLGVAGAAIAAGPARAADLKVLSAEAPRDALEAVAGQFGKSAATRVSFGFMTAGQVRDRILKDENADLAIASSAFIDEMVKSGKAVSAGNLGRIGLAIAIHEGAPAPDISTPEKFVAVLRAAKSVAFTDPAAGGTAGQYFAGLLQRLGIADEIKAKAVLSKGGRDAAQRVAKGEAEIGITFPSEIAPIEGAKVAGMLPDSLQNYVIYQAAIPAAGANKEAAKAFVAALRAAAAAEHWKAAGFEPPAVP